MVGSGVAGFEELDAAARIRCSRGDDGGEVFEGDVVGAGVGNQRTARLEHAEGAEVEFLVAARGAFGGSLGLREGGWVEVDGVEPFLLRIVGAEEVEGVGFDPVCLGAEVGVEREVVVGGFKGGAAGVDAGDEVAGFGEMKGETALVGTDV